MFTLNCCKIKQNGLGFTSCGQKCSAFTLATDYVPRGVAANDDIGIRNACGSEKMFLSVPDSLHLTGTCFSL